MKTSVVASSEQRKARLKQLLHIGKSQLGWDDDFYREVIVSVTRNPARNSSTQLTLQELDHVLDKMKAGGFKVRTKSGGRAAESPIDSKIIALWLELHRLGYVNDPSDKALRAYVTRMTKINAIRWLNNYQTQRVVESLKKWLDRDRIHIESLHDVAVAQGREPKDETLDDFCARISGSTLPTRAAAEKVIAYLEGRGHGA